MKKSLHKNHVGNGGKLRTNLGKAKHIVYFEIDFTSKEQKLFGRHKWKYREIFNVFPIKNNFLTDFFKNLPRNYLRTNSKRELYNQTILNTHQWHHTYHHNHRLMIAPSLPMKKFFQIFLKISAKEIILIRMLTRHHDCSANSVTNISNLSPTYTALSIRHHHRCSLA